jgi:NitT/TauT family transport system permease protein
VAANFGATRAFLFGSVILPAAMPQILVGLRVGLGISWVNLVAGEMLGAQSGLGYLIVDARNSLRTDRIVAVMLLIGLLGFVLDRLMALVTKATSWSFQ